MTKLTLRVDERIVKQAKRLAAQNHTSVSAMFSRLIVAMAQASDQDGKPTPITDRATGLIRLPPGQDEYRDILSDALKGRYGQAE